MSHAWSKWLSYLPVTALMACGLPSTPPAGGGEITLTDYNHIYFFLSGATRWDLP